MLYVYGYDQLNRITRQKAYNGLNPTTNTWTPVDINTGDYNETVNYSGNGNILNYTRNGNTVGTSNAMDNLHYGYNYDANNHLINNKLRFINDDVTSSNYGGADLQTQGGTNSQPNSADNYQYDAIGNLIKDNQANITGNSHDAQGIRWTVYGKIQSVNKSTGTSINYAYNTTGQRVSKAISGGNTTYYVRDAQGNTLATYDQASSTSPLKWTEQDLYGSSRLGTWSPRVNLTTGNADDGEQSWQQIGHKSYQLSNHLGNVLATITDRNVPHYTSGTFDYFEADVATAQDYYPFGLLQPGRQYSNPNSNAIYKYGFNGKENDKDIQGNDYDYGFRIYNPQLGRFLSVDPLANAYPWYTPYQFAGNSPLMYVDVDGAEGFLSIFLPNAFSEENTTKLKNTLGVSKGGFWDKTIDFVAGAGDEAVKLNKPQTYFNTVVDHVTALGSNVGKIATANTNGEKAKAAAQVLAPSLIEADPTAIQIQKAVNGDMRVAGNIATNISVAVLMHRMGDSNLQKSDMAEKSMPTNVQRPTFRESENDLTPPGSNKQESFKNGNTVKYGMRGSVRPEGYDGINRNSFEVKNYDITTKKGINSLINNVVKQARQRLSNLPKGTKQNVIIDVRGQEVNQATLNRINNRISTQVGSQNVNVTFKTTN